MPDFSIDNPLSVEQAMALADQMMADVPSVSAKSRPRPTLPSHPWIPSFRRKLVGYWSGEQAMRTVWQASTKLGTMPGGIGWFSSPPEIDVVCEWWQVTLNPLDVRWQQPRRVHVDRIDDVIQRVFVSLV